MANRNKKNRRNRNKKRNGAIGLLFLELIGVVAFAALLMLARSGRDVPSEDNTDAVAITANFQSSTAWEKHRPRFSQVVGDLWEAGF
jgi:hypothetical protein